MDEVTLECFLDAGKSQVVRQDFKVEIAIPACFANPGIPKFLLPGSWDLDIVRNASRRYCLMEDFGILSLL